MQEFLMSYSSVIVASFISAHTPGPNNIMLLRSGNIFGYKKSLMHIFGILAGFCTLVLVVNLGLYSIMLVFPWTFMLVKIIGSIYFLWLSIKIILTDVQKVSDEINKTNKSFENDSIYALKPFSFIQAFFFQWINIKAVMYAISVRGLYNKAFTLESIIIFIIIILISTVSATHMWVLLGVVLQKLIKKVWIMRTINTILALSLIWFGINMWLS